MILNVYAIIRNRGDFMAHILIVEDEKSLSDLIAINLSLVGNTSAQVYGYNEAHDCLKKNTYSLIIMDIVLPG